jgi:hypothetical protein
MPEKKHLSLENENINIIIIRAENTSCYYVEYGHNNRLIFDNIVSLLLFLTGILPHLGLKEPEKLILALTPNNDG